MAASHGRKGCTLPTL